MSKQGSLCACSMCPGGANVRRMGRSPRRSKPGGIFRRHQVGSIQTPRTRRPGLFGKADTRHNGLLRRAGQHQGATHVHHRRHRRAGQTGSGAVCIDRSCWRAGDGVRHNRLGSGRSHQSGGAWVQAVADRARQGNNEARASQTGCAALSSDTAIPGSPMPTTSAKHRRYANGRAGGVALAMAANTCSMRTVCTEALKGFDFKRALDGRVAGTGVDTGSGSGRQAGEVLPRWRMRREVVPSQPGKAG